MGPPAGWIDDGRDDLRQHAGLSRALDDWLTVGRDPDYLLTGGRLDQFEHWRATTTMRLTVAERDFLDAARRQRVDAEAAEFGEARSRLGCVAGPAAGRSHWGAAVAVIAAATIVALSRPTGTSEPLKVTVVAAVPRGQRRRQRSTSRASFAPSGTSMWSLTAGTSSHQPTPASAIWLGATPIS